MQTIDEQDRKAFADVGMNSLIEYTDEECAQLAEMAAKIRLISRDAQTRLRKAS